MQQISFAVSEEECPCTVRVCSEVVDDLGPLGGQPLAPLLDLVSGEPEVAKTLNFVVGARPSTVGRIDLELSTIGTRNEDRRRLVAVCRHLLEPEDADVPRGQLTRVKGTDSYVGEFHAHTFPSDRP